MGFLGMANEKKLSDHIFSLNENDGNIIINRKSVQ